MRLKYITTGYKTEDNKFKFEKMSSNYGNGWKSKSGKKRLNSIKIPAVIVNQMVAATGAVEINLIKYDELSPLSAMNLASKTS